MYFLEKLLSLHVVQLAIDVCAEVLHFDALPLVLIIQGATECKGDLFLCELAILAHRIEANHVLNLLGLVWLYLDVLPTALISGILPTVVFYLFLALLLLIFVINLSSFLLGQTVPTA